MLCSAQSSHQVAHAFHFSITWLNQGFFFYYQLGPPLFNLCFVQIKFERMIYSIFCIISMTKLYIYIVYWLKYFLLWSLLNWFLPFHLIAFLYLMLLSQKNCFLFSSIYISMIRKLLFCSKFHFAIIYYFTWISNLVHLNPSAWLLSLVLLLLL